MWQNMSSSLVSLPPRSILQVATLLLTTTVSACPDAVQTSDDEDTLQVHSNRGKNRPALPPRLNTKC